MELQDVLKALRSNKALSQRELAKMLNVSPSTIAMYETGQRTPDTDTIKMFADFFNVSTDYLLGRTADPNPLSAEDDPDDEIQPTPPERIRTFQKKIGELSEESLTFLEFQLERLRELDREAVKRRRAERDAKNEKK
ncbi:MAG TPA: transcriptional regulator [Desulfosporosinus sp.]|nr:transcriptional regulator [Desulfosporosinus sp.]